MSLNKYMHPRNRYKNAKPSFLHLALKYSDFRAMTTQDESGKVFLDFKNADALRALTRCLLKEDFDLSVELPTDRLVPTLPLRLNYIHWLEDIIGTDEKKWGIDIGTGASCVYPLLAGKMNKWNFLATEMDAENLYHAQKNVTNNSLSHLIHVKKNSDESILTTSVQSFTETEVFDFCMCNPPFFADHMEAQGLVTTRSDDRPEAGSVSTASPQECIVAGGEVAFVRQMIEESTVLRAKIRVYTSMLGKKSSLAQLKEELRHQKVAKFSTTEFCQGKTMRWGLAWTFDPSVIFPRSQFETRKAKPPLQYVIPKGLGSVDYKVHELARYLRQLLESIKVHCYQGKKAKSYTSITLTAAENTWCHQRRLRRQKQRKSSGSTSEDQPQAQPYSKGRKDETLESRKVTHHTEGVVEGTGMGDSGDATTATVKGKSDEVVDSSEYVHLKSSNKRSSDDLLETNHNDAKRLCIESNRGVGAFKDSRAKISTEIRKTKENVENTRNSVPETEDLPCASSAVVEAESSSATIKSGDATSTNKSNISTDVSERRSGLSDDELPANKTTEVLSEAVASVSTEELSQPKEYVLKCVMRLKRADEKINLELEWLDGKSRELMHQVFTFLKNKLSQI